MLKIQAYLKEHGLEKTLNDFKLDSRAYRLMLVRSIKKIMEMYYEANENYVNY
jgi:hypothetical protein